MRRKKQELKSNKNESEKLLLQFCINLSKFFPNLKRDFRSIYDPRQSGKCKYKIEEIMYLSLLLMCFSLNSRNNYNQEFRISESIEVLNKLFGLNLESIAHGDTLSYLWEKLNYNDLENIRHKMVSSLIKERYLDNIRFKKSYLVAFDGTEIYRWNKRHCDNCLYSKMSNGEYQYFHRVLEAKIVSESGFSISIATEFIENIDKQEDDKQDCELKAFYRLSDKVKKLFPRLSITILADSLYPNLPVFEKCLLNNWNYIFVLKDKVLTSVWEEFNYFFDSIEGTNIEIPENYFKNNRYRWINDLYYKDLRVNVLQIAYQNQEGIYQTKRSFITNYQINNFDSSKKIEQIGQLRWKIENQGFDIQKNHGYNLEHTYSKNPNAMKVVYLLIQIAHIINQLFINSNLLQACNGLSLKSCFKKIMNAISYGLSQTLEQFWVIISNKKYYFKSKPT